MGGGQTGRGSEEWRQRQLCVRAAEGEELCSVSIGTGCGLGRPEPARQKDKTMSEWSLTTEYAYKLPAATMCEFCSVMDSLGSGDWNRF
eukprot:g23617.t1